MRSIAWLPWVALLAAGAANAADVYKCTVDGSTVYQDRPCKGEMVKPPALDKASLTALWKLHDDLHAERDRVLDEFQRREQAGKEEVRSRLGLRSRDSIPYEEAKRIQETTAPLLYKSEEIYARLEAVIQEIRRRCPGGSSGGPKVACRQR